MKCKDCGMKKATNFYSSDGWDRMEDWICTGKKDKKIAGAVEWHEENKIEAPKWCPLKKKKEKKYTKKDLCRAYKAGENGEDLDKFIENLS